MRIVCNIYIEIDRDNHKKDEEKIPNIKRINKRIKGMGLCLVD